MFYFQCRFQVGDVSKQTCDPLIPGVPGEKAPVNERYKIQNDSILLLFVITSIHPKAAGGVKPPSLIATVPPTGYNSGKSAVSTVPMTTGSHIARRCSVPAAERSYEGPVFELTHSTGRKRNMANGGEQHEP